MRSNVPEADALIDQLVPVLDYGFVVLVDYMGSDAAIVRAARTSTGTTSKSAADDRALIRRMMRDRHTSPFEFCEFTFLCQMPIFVARQWIRHRTANVSEVSGRYGELPELTYVPEHANVQYQHPLNKQGRGAVPPPTVAQALVASLRTGAHEAFQRYHEYLGQGAADEQKTFDPFDFEEMKGNGGISRELARINLPLSTYTKWYWKIDLHNLLHFLSLRLDPHAQWEIRQYAEVMARAVKAVCPVVWDAFEDFRLNAVTLSGPEVAVLQRWMESPGEVLDVGMSKSEKLVFIGHLRRLGFNKFAQGLEAT